MLLDAPCYFNFHANLALHGVKVVTLERRLDGYDPAHRDWMRFNVAHSEEPQVQRVFEALVQGAG